MLEPLGAATARAELKVPATLSAPLFRACIERLDETRRIVVLDLGRAQTATLDLFTGYRCRMEIVDIADDIEALNAEPDRAALGDRVDGLLPGVGNEPIDLVLCWDLLNYLNRPTLTAVMAAIAKRARPGALAHGLIVYLESRMPAEPASYVPLEDYRLVSTTRSRGDRAAPRYSPEDLKRCMPDFSIERGRLLANGMQEFLFRR